MFDFISYLYMKAKLFCAFNYCDLTACGDLCFSCIFPRWTPQILWMRNITVLTNSSITNHMIYLYSTQKYCSMLVTRLFMHSLSE